MPHAYERHAPSMAPAEYQGPMYMINGPMYMIFFPCPCGREPCVQPVLVNSHHIRAMQADGRDGIVHIPLPVPDRDVPHVLEQYAMPENFPHVHYHVPVAHFPHEHYDMRAEHFPHEHYNVQAEHFPHEHYDMRAEHFPHEHHDMRAEHFPQEHYDARAEHFPQEHRHAMPAENLPVEHHAAAEHLPNEEIVNDLEIGAHRFGQPEPGWLEYPTYPEVQPREYRRRHRSRRHHRRNVTNDCSDSGNESDVDR